MTLIACWVRRNKAVRELVIAADSRVSGGESWDSCPKIIALPRPSTVMAMSGETGDSHPFVIHAINTCQLLDGHVVGRTDIKYFANQLTRVYQDNRKHVTDLPVGETVSRIPDMHLLLAGWSWRRMRFEAFTYRFDDTGRMTCQGHGLDGASKSSLFVGDGADASVGNKPVSARRSPKSCRPRSQAATGTQLHWQPLDVLLQSIDDREARSIGGAPQIARIYQSGLTEQFIWRGHDGIESFGGRPVLDSERSDRRVMSAIRTERGIQVDIRFSERSILATAGASIDPVD